MTRNSLSIPTAVCIAVTACMLTVLATGCGGRGYEGDQRARITGTVSYKGEPIKNGTINLRPDGEGGRKAGSSIVDGKYEIKEANGPTFAKYKVEIFAFEPIGGGSADGDAEADEKTRQVLPKQYNNDSTIELNVDSADVEKDFELK